MLKYSKCKGCICNGCNSKLKYDWCNHCGVCDNYQPIQRKECCEENNPNK